MNEEKRKTACGEEKSVCGSQSGRSQSTHTGGKIKDEKATDPKSSTASDNEFSANAGGSERYFILANCYALKSC